MVAALPPTGVQTYVSAPLAVSSVFSPAHISTVAGESVTTGSGLTTTCRVAVSEQPRLVPVTVYVVVPDGLTVADAALPPEGDQLYVVAPLAVSVTLSPAQMVAVAGLMLTTGSGVTATCRMAVSTQPRVVPVTVYIVAAAGLTLIDAVAPLPGDQLYVVAPLAVSVTLSPAQMVAVAGLMLTTGSGVTTTWRIAVSEQPAAPPVTVYMAVVAGLTVIDAVLPPPGDQLYVVAPLAVSVTLSPAQMVTVTGLMFTLEAVLTIIAVSRDK